MVRRADPFQLTTEPFTKFVPFTVSTKPVELHDGEEFDDVVEDESDVMAGARIEKEIPPDVPPPGPGVNTVIWELPADWKSLPGTVAVS